MDNNDDDTIITPRDPNTLFNFGPASSTLDHTLYTAERPGGDNGDETIPKQCVTEWVNFMRQEQGICSVLVLLDDNELEGYEEPGLLQLYKDAGMEQVAHTPMGEKGAYTRVMTMIQNCETNGTKIVTHCTHGQGRAGRVAAGWLATRYNLSPEEATQQALDTAKEKGMTRLGSPSKLKKWMEHI